MVHCSFIYGHEWLQSNQFVKHIKIVFVQVGVVCAAWWHLREFSHKKTTHASALHCVLQLKTWTKTVCTCFTKIIDEQPSLTQYERPIYQMKQKWMCYHPLITVLWFFFSSFRDLGIESRFPFLKLTPYTCPVFRIVIISIPTFVCFQSIWSSRLDFTTRPSISSIWGKNFCGQVSLGCQWWWTRALFGRFVNTSLVNPNPRKNPYTRGFVNPEIKYGSLIRTFGALFWRFAIGVNIRDQFRLGWLRSVARIFYPLLARKLLFEPAPPPPPRLVHLWDSLFQRIVNPKIYYITVIEE